MGENTWKRWKYYFWWAPSQFLVYSTSFCVFEVLTYKEDFWGRTERYLKKWPFTAYAYLELPSKQYKKSKNVQNCNVRFDLTLSLYMIIYSHITSRFMHSRQYVITFYQQNVKENYKLFAVFYSGWEYIGLKISYMI